YRLKNETEPSFDWEWKASSGRFPDQYSIDHMLELQANPPVEGKRPDNGYSSWVELPEGQIYFVDYTNKGDQPPTAHLYGAVFSKNDFPTGAASAALRRHVLPFSKR
ncbi:MAG: hypothetical protein L0338_16565, partial [Acidobacteria bacterium]|nr:hypothetical protein [Acidobacteriota bacterium]